MAYAVEYTNEFAHWWSALNADEQESVYTGVELLESEGPNLRFPHSSGVSSSKHGQLRELRVQHRGRPFRLLYAFDPRRCAILLIGGDKTGDDRWYAKYVPIADRLFDEHLRALHEEGLN